MEMELVGILKVLWRWKWLIIGLVAITGIGLFTLTRNSDPLYSAYTTLQITTPDREDVAVVDAYAYTSDRDEITIAINNFLEVAAYEEVRRRTLEQLGLEEEYDLTVEAELGADLIYIEVAASSPQLAADIANVHTAEAVNYFGELRAGPSQRALDHFSTQLAIAEEEVRAAEAALIAFQQEHGISSLQEELRLQQLLLTQLEEAREQFLLDTITAESETAQAILDRELQLLDLEAQIKQQEVAQLQLQLEAANRDLLTAEANSAEAEAATFTGTAVEEEEETEPTDIETLTATISDYEAQIFETEQAINELNLARLELERTQLSENDPTTAVDDTATLTRLDNLIDQQRQQLANVALLEPEHNLLQKEIQRTREKYELLAEKYTETDLRQAFASEAMFIQTMNQASPPDTEQDNSTRLILFGIIGSLGLGVLLAFLLDYLIPKRPTSASTATSPAPTPTPDAPTAAATAERS